MLSATLLTPKFLRRLRQRCRIHTGCEPDDPPTERNIYRRLYPSAKAPVVWIQRIPFDLISHHEYLVIFCVVAGRSFDCVTIPDLNALQGGAKVGIHACVRFQPGDFFHFTVT